MSAATTQLRVNRVADRISLEKTPHFSALQNVLLRPVGTNITNAHLQEVEEFVKKVNGNGGQFELHVYDDAGHAFLTSDEHRESKLPRQAQTLCDFCMHRPLMAHCMYMMMRGMHS